MQLARVIGTVVASIKDPSLIGEKILMIQPLTDDLKPAGNQIAAADVAQAGVGDLVHWVSAREAAFALHDSNGPADAAVTGIVDDVNQNDVGITNKEEVFE